jgi:hypothetical protein
MAAFTTLALLGLAAASTASSAVAEVKAGKAAKKAGQQEQAASEDQAQVDDYNASVADLQATDATQVGAEQESQYRASVRSTLGSNRAKGGASGVDVNFGSAVDTQGDIANLGEQDALQIRTNAARQAWGYNVQAYDLRRAAGIARKTGAAQAEAGSEAQSASYWQAAGTIAGGTSSLLQAKYGFGQKN